jgi:endoglucanase
MQFPPRPAVAARVALPTRRRLLVLAALALASACSDAAPTTAPDDVAARRPRTPAPTAPTVPTTPTTPSVPTATSSANPLAGVQFYGVGRGDAARQAKLWRASRPADAAQMDKIAAQPQAEWLGEWSGDVRATVDEMVGAAAAAGRTAVLVAYDIPQRDCGLYSAGGASSASAYRSWIAGIAAGLRGRRAVLVLEPDALAGMDCLSAADQATRVDLLRGAVTTLSAAGALVYVDAGNTRWHPSRTIADRLARVGIAEAAGFALNVSNFLTTEENVTYGSEISQLVGGKHFLIDTSRNGLVATANLAWCNPSGRALGPRPTTATGQPLVDAFVWVKSPGESDGSCNGAPGAGAWMPEYALGLAQRAAY